MTITVTTMVAGTVLPASVSSLYTVPANTRAVIQAATLMNTSSNAVTTSVYCIPVGSTVSVSTLVINGRSISPNETYTCPEMIGKSLDATGTIQALASNVSAISFQVNGYVVT